MLDVRSCPPSAPRVDSLVLWRTEILFSSDFSASSPSRLAPELSRSLSRPSTLLQTGLVSSDRRCARDYQGFCLRIEFVLNTGFILRLSEWLKICFGKIKSNVNDRFTVDAPDPCDYGMKRYVIQHVIHFALLNT